jgi:hypothetical protein
MSWGIVENPESPLMNIPLQQVTVFDRVEMNMQQPSLALVNNT